MKLVSLLRLIMLICAIVLGLFVGLDMSFPNLGAKVVYFIIYAVFVLVGITYVAIKMVEDQED